MMEHLLEYIGVGTMTRVSRRRQGEEPKPVPLVAIVEIDDQGEIVPLTVAKFGDPIREDVTGITEGQHLLRPQFTFQLATAAARLSPTLQQIDRRDLDDGRREARPSQDLAICRAISRAPS